MFNRYNRNTRAPLDVPSPFLKDACKIWLCPSEERTIRELHQLAPKERVKVWADLCGDESLRSFQKTQDCQPNQEEQLLLLQLDEAMTKEVETHLPQTTPAMKKYLGDRSFRLMFLHSTQGDPVAAAKKVVQHIQLKQELFGEEIASRDVLLEDFSAADMVALESGMLQWLNDRDHRGNRKVLFYRAKNLNLELFSPASALKTLFYLIMIEMRQLKTQKLGIVLLSSYMDDFQSCFPYELVRKGLRFEQAMPVRLVAHYILFQKNCWKPVIDVVCHMSSPTQRMRTRSIFGKFGCYPLFVRALFFQTTTLPFVSDESSSHVEFLFFLK
jgi:hypothetical protein